MQALAAHICFLSCQGLGCIGQNTSLCTPDMPPAHVGWQFQGSAWKRYVAQAAEAAATVKGAPLTFGVSASAQPEQPQSEAPVASEQATKQAAVQQPEETAVPAASAPAAPVQAFPAQLSLDRLQAERRSSLQQNPDGEHYLVASLPYARRTLHPLA